MHTEEVSALRFGPLDKSGSYAGNVVIGLWNDFSIKVLSTYEDFQRQKKHEISLMGLPRSLALVNFRNDGVSHVLVGQGDGAVVAVPFSQNTGFNETEKKISNLGDSPVSLSTCVINGRVAVIASGTRCSMVLWKNGLEFTPVLLKVRG